MRDWEGHNHLQRALGLDLRLLWREVPAVRHLPQALRRLHDQPLRLVREVGRRQLRPAALVARHLVRVRVRFG